MDFVFGLALAAGLFLRWAVVQVVVRCQTEGARRPAGPDRLYLVRGEGGLPGGRPFATVERDLARAPRLRVRRWRATGDRR